MTAPMCSMSQNKTNMSCSKWKPQRHKTHPVYTLLISWREFKFLSWDKAPADMVAHSQALSCVSVRCALFAFLHVRLSDLVWSHTIWSKCGAAQDHVCCCVNAGRYFFKLIHSRRGEMQSCVWFCKLLHCMFLIQYNRITFSQFTLQILKRLPGAFLGLGRSGTRCVAWLSPQTVPCPLAANMAAGAGAAAALLMGGDLGAEVSTKSPHAPKLTSPPWCTMHHPALWQSGPATFADCLNSLQCV